YWAHWAGIGWRIRGKSPFTHKSARNCRERRIHGQKHRRSATARKGEYGRGAEVRWRMVQEHAGDRGRVGRLFQESLRAGDRHCREARQREVARQGFRGAERLREELI